jgi:hypothetical protein
MSDWFSIQTLVAFVLGVMLSAMVKGLVSNVKGKVA